MGPVAEADKMSKLSLFEPELSHVATQTKHAQVKRSSSNMVGIELIVISSNDLA